MDRHDLDTAISTVVAKAREEGRVARNPNGSERGIILTDEDHQRLLCGGAHGWQTSQPYWDVLCIVKEGEKEVLYL